MTQARALSILKSGVNVYLTGSAGSGKTYVLNQYIDYLKRHDVQVAVTASTGIAATHMGGMTIHGWSGIGIREELTAYDLDALSQKAYLWKRFEKTKVLIIDEVSMLHARTLDMVDQVCRQFKQNPLPFGGMQVVLSGDFFQLPPITKGPRPYVEGVDHDPDAANPDLVVYSRSWKEMTPAICYLSEQHRQSEDESFLSILNAMRGDGLDEVHFEYLNERMNVELADGMKPTRLYTHNADVDLINNQELSQVAGEERTYRMEAHGSAALVEALKKACLAPEVLRLRVGAQVMFLKNNFDAGYVNGTRGVVTAFSAEGAPIVKVTNGTEIEVAKDSWAVEENGVVKASLEQYPLRLAWAITIHKSQGMSLDSAEIDLSKAFAPGMGYVALSRVRTLEGVRLVGLNPSALQVDPAIRELDLNLRQESDENESMFGDLDEASQTKLEHEFLERVGGSIEEIDVTKVSEPKTKTPTILETLALLEDGLSIDQIADKRKLTPGTVIEHLEKLKAEDYAMSLDHVRPVELLIDRVRSHSEASEGKLTPIKRALEREGINVSFDEIRLARLFI